MSVTAAGSTSPLRFNEAVSQLVLAYPRPPQPPSSNERIRAQADAIRRRGIDVRA